MSWTCMPISGIFRLQSNAPKMGMLQQYAVSNIWHINCTVPREDSQEYQGNHFQNRNKV